jgi:hypothetical protein
LNFLLDTAGFKSIKVEPQGGVFSSIFFKLNYFLSRAVRGPRLLRILIKLLMIPVFIFNQILAFFLDKGDFSWSLESPGYVVTAFK